MSLYLGNTPIAVNSSSRNIGEIIQSTIPLTDAGLHLLDGSLISGSGAYSAFVDYIADLYGDGTNIPDFFMKDGQDIAWTQPTLSANGTLGGDNFAVSASSEFSSEYAAWKAFDGVASSDFATSGNSLPCYIEFYNPIPLKVTSLSITNRQGSGSVESFTGGTVYGSNNGTDWTSLTTYTNNNTTGLATWTISLNTNTDYYKYYKIEATSVSGTNNGFSNIAITAVYFDTSITAEDKWQSDVTTYGVCGKFVYDSVNGTVRLPKITGFTEGTITPTTLGDLTQAGLPNITGSWTGTFIEGTNPSPAGTGAFSGMEHSKSGSYYGGAFTNNPNWNISANGGEDYTQLRFDASLSNSIYGNSTTVQPQSIKVLYYICIATATKTNIEVDIDQIATDLNGKADVDLTNVNNSGTSTGASWAMPSNTYDNLTLGASGSTYTAPADGYFIFYGSYSTGSQMYVDFYSSSAGLGHRHNYANTWTDCRCFIPVKKNDILTVVYNGTFGYQDFKFVYAKGSEWEKTNV